MTHRNCRAPLLAAVGGLIVLFAAPGCSGVKLQNIAGTVILNGKPLPSGVVQFHGPGDRIATANIQPDGTFVVTDLIPGDVKVAITESVVNAPMRSAPPHAKVQGLSAPEQQKNSPIPPKYKDVKTSGLNYTIAPDTERLDISLKS